MLKHLLVPMTGLPADRAALTAALGLARAFDAHVDALFIRQHPADAVPLLGEGMSGAMIDDIVRAAEAETNLLQEAARRLFEALLVEHEVPAADVPPEAPGPTAAWRETVGRPDEMAALEGRLADLIVLPHCGDDPNGRLTLAAETALLDSGRPILLAPATTPTEIGRRIAIAWNGGAESARAVAGAMPFLHAAEAVTVLTAETHATPSTAAARLAQHLAWHRTQVRVQVVHPGADAVGHALLSSAKADGCDLLVLGGYGHSRMREMILGGVTRYMLTHADIPVLMAH
ncbi:MAG TPA: universal stress protein [Azospirillaceae bacterium]|nr:universal stress protein [Azospirillaceae bacterium]HRQ80993.1 universal stress protein [Azospirillaceae bacterium]